jgi:molybdenum cofactor guanylyltransferase
MPSNIFILSQPIQSGKTTLLQKWIANKKQIGGILTPDVNGKRKLLSISEQTLYDFQLNETDEGTRIGRFVFDEKVFAKARQLLLNEIEEIYEWIVIDEIGRLEIDQIKGLEPAISEVIKHVQTKQSNTKLVLVVRDYLLQEAIEKYHLQDAIILDETFFLYPQIAISGLVLCGGQSVRMGRDKAFMTYHHLPQYAHVANMMKLFCNDIFISCNAQQKSLFKQDYKLIEDNATFKNAGPMTGLLSAFQQVSNTGFLVLGCDYPNFTHADMKALLRARNESFDAVCFYNQASGFDEPLLAIYEKQCAPLLFDFYRNGQTSLKQFLKTIRTKRIVAANPESLISVDS